MGCADCVCCADPKESREPLKYDPEFRGPVKNRSCTDILFLLIFVIFTAGWIYVGVYASTRGDVKRILAPTDELGQKCGLDSSVLDKPYLVFFDITQCLSPTTPLTGCPTPQVCVESCPSETIIFTPENVAAMTIADLRQRLVCRYSVNKDSITTAQQALLHIQNGLCTSYVLASHSVISRCIGDLSALACDRSTSKSQRNSPFQRKTNAVAISTMNGNPVTCLRNPNRASSKIMSKATALDTYIGMIIASWVAFFTKDESQASIMSNQIIEDMVQARWYLLGGLVVAIFICLIFIALMRWIVAPLVWFSLIGLIALLGFLLYLCYKQYRFYLDHPVTLQVSTNIYGWAQSMFQDSTAWLVLLIILAVVLLILLLMVVFLRKRIVIATALIKEGSKAVSSIKSTFAFPIFPWILHCVVIVFGVVVIMFLMSIGESQFRVVGLNATSDSTCVCTTYQDYDYCDPIVFNSQCHDTQTNLACRHATCHFVGIVSPTYITYLHLVNIVGFFWVIFFIQGLSEMMLASTFATWYWSLNKSNVPFFTLTAGCWRSIRYHMGTVAFGSLIITIVRLIRLVLEYIDHKLKKYDNAITKAVLCCCKCLFLCLENFLRFINKNAYIMCAVHGKGFCASARDAFSLLMRNILRVFVLDKVTDFVFFLSKLLVSLGVGVGVYYLLQWNAVYDLTGEERLNYNLVPAIILAVATYLIASLFFNVYAMAVDTLFLCFLEDCERNDGSPEKPYFMSKNLMKILHKRNKAE